MSPARTRSRPREAGTAAPWREDLHGAREASVVVSIPDAISQLEYVDRTLLTRRDIERLFGVSIGRGRRARAPTNNCSTAFFAPSTAGERW